jgi:hypothetical protein
MGATHVDRLAGPVTISLTEGVGLNCYPSGEREAPSARPIWGPRPGDSVTSYNVYYVK